MMANTFLSVLGISVSVSVIAASLAALTPFLNKRYAAKWKYWIWIFLALRLIIPFGGAGGKTAADALSQMTAQIVSNDSKPEKNHADTRPDKAALPARVIVRIPPQMTAPIAGQAEKSSHSITPLDIAAFAWLAGSLFFIAVHLGSYFKLKRQIQKKGKAIKDSPVLRQITELKEELRIRRTVSVIEYQEAASPMVIGFFQPALILPDTQYSPEELFFILKHELVHLKRRDIWFKLIFVVANAVHWFNPFIWIMQKEAVVDMELSCDERVTQGADYAGRRAYTETLLSTLHKQCTKRTVLSTQFYGGKQIMKKRFKNILLKNGKKNGVCILICAVILTISVGTLVGCSAAKENAAVNAEDASVQSEKEDMQSADNPSGDNNLPDNTTMLSFSKEGITEQKQAALMAGDGYSIYLPDNEWQQSGADKWTAVANKQVMLWVTHFKDTAINELEEELADDGYGTVNHDMTKREGDIIYKVKLNQSGNDIWGVYYCYPADAEEGWGRELPVIADTFAVSASGQQPPASFAVSADGSQTAQAGEPLGWTPQSHEEPLSADSGEIERIVKEFAEAYFGGDEDALRRLLTSPYDYKISLYEGNGRISDLAVKGLPGAGECQTGSMQEIELEYRDSSVDTLQYLAFTFIKQKDGWKIKFFGLDG